MPADVSIYNTRPPEPVNPLALVQGYASASNSLAENKLLQQTIRGRQALGQIIAKNTDETGIVNPSSALRDISQNPDAAWMYTQEQEQFKNANPLTSYMGTNAAGQPTPAQAPLYKVPGVFPPANAGQAPQLTQDKIDEFHNHNQAMIKTLEPIANDPNVDHKKVIRAVSDLVADPNAQFNASDGASALSAIPFGSNGQPPSPQEIHAKVQPLLAQQKTNEAILSQKYPSSAQLAARKTAQALVNTGIAEPSQNSNPTDLGAGSPGVAAGLPVGYTSPLSKSRENYDRTSDAATNIPNTLAAYNEVINLNNNGALTGTNLSKAYQVAARNDPLHILTGATEEATKTQEMAKWMSQALIQNGMPNSDARLQELQHGNLNPEQLSETVKELAPFFKAVAQGAVEKQNYYNKATNNGTNLTNEPQALQDWTNNFDPRWLEYNELHDVKAKRAFLTNHPDLIDKRDKYHNLQQMGVVGSQ